VYQVSLLKEISRLTNDPDDRLNVTPYFYHHPEKYRVLNLLAPPELDRPQYRLCVDHPEDFAVVTAIYEGLYPQKPAFTAFDIVRFLDQNPELARQNTWREDSFTFPSSGGQARQEVLNVQ
jgi:spore coat polysaccharide biosynthesis protein SpsF